MKPCLNVNYNFIIVTGGKLISSNIFLSSYNPKYFLKNATIYNSRDKVTFMNSSNIRYIFCNKRFNDFLERQMSKDKLNSLLAIKMWNFYTLYSFDVTIIFLNIVIFFSTVFIVLLQVISLSHPQMFLR